MRSLQRYIFLLSVFLISINAFGIELSDTTSMKFKADSLFSIGEYYEASLLYHKASYFSLSEKNKALLLLRKTDCLKQCGSFAEGGQALSKIDLLALSDSLIIAIKYQEGFCAYLAQDYQLAESHLIQTVLYTKDSSLIIPTLPILSLTFNELNKWQESKRTLLLYISKTYQNNLIIRDSLVKNLETFYAKENIPKLKKPNKARIMSHIIPGLGQCYAGYYKEGISSFLINAAIVGGAVVGVYFHYYITAFIGGNALLGKFYIGNVNRAQFLTNKRNYLQSKKYNTYLKENILKISK
ncbi:MAG: hypothetical protein KBG47_01040 [Bacteroidia bacterium]|nr:hypothetical protein [Bacteroidia bacterium]